MNVDNLKDVNGTEMRNAVFFTSHCRVEFGAVEGSHKVLVTRVDASTWDVRTQAPTELDPNLDVAFCADGVRAYHMPFGVTVELKP